MSPNTQSLGVVPETSEEAQLRNEQARPGSKAGLWFLVGTMAVLAFAILRDLVAACFR